MARLIRYVLFQVPGWIIAATLLFGLWYSEFLPRWLALVCFPLWVIKDFLLYPLLGAAYDPEVKTGSEKLVGATGVVRGDLAPEGSVFVQGELWRARADPDDTAIPQGTEVQVLGVEGMKLFVRAVHGAKHS